MTSKAGHTAGSIARRMVDKLFEGRKGHGGASVSYLQMRPDDVASVIEGAIELYDAGNETGLTPRQLAEQRDELLAALREIETICTESAGDCRRRMGTRVGNTIATARAAIAKAKATAGGA